MEILRSMEDNRQKLIKGIFKAVTMVFQDNFRVRERPDDGRVMQSEDLTKEHTITDPTISDVPKLTTEKIVS